MYGGIQNLLCGNLDSKTLAEFPQFQQEVIRTWSKLSYNNKKFIWNNKAITVNKCTVFNRSMFQCGIWFPEDLFEKGRLTPFDEWCKRGLDKKYYMLWRGLATTVLKENKQKPVQGEQNLWMLSAKVDGEEVVRPLESISSKEIYLLLIQKKLCRESAGKKTYNDEYHMNNQTWNKIYTVYGRSWKNKKVLDFQYKVLHRVVALNPLLFKMGIKDKCTFCNDEKETIQHMLYRCKKVRKFWKQVKDWFNSIIDGDIDILETDVIFGNLTYLPHVKECNAIIILGKYFIYGCKLKENIPILPNFLRRIKSELEAEKEIANNLNKIERFLDKWGEFWTSLRNITV